MNNLYKQKQYSVLYKNRVNRMPKTVVNLYNDKNIQIDSLDGIALDGNVNIDADGTNRRNGSLTLRLDDTLLPKPENKIWFNKRIGIEVQLLDYDGTVVPYNIGRFMVDEPSYSKSGSERSIQIMLKDYMSMWDGTFGGNLSHEMLITPQSAIVEQAIISIVQGLSKYSVDGMDINGSNLLVPKEIRRSPNSTIYEALKELVELYMGYEMFFDANGYFRVQKIKDKRFDPIVWDFSQDNMDLVIDNINSFKFSNVRNSIWVWGLKKEDGSQVKWVYRNRWARKYYSDLSNLTDRQKGDICHIDENNNSYMWDGSAWMLLDFKVVSIFSIENIGEKVFSYVSDEIFTEQQAMLRAEFELQQQSNFAEEVTISCVPIYLLDGNSKIRIIDKDTGIEGDYLIKNISLPPSFEGSMTIKCNKIYY